MNALFIVAIMAVTIALAVITNARIAHVLALRWSFSKEPRLFFCWLSSIAAGAIIAVASFALINYGGLAYGMIGAVMVVPVVGVAWFFIVGANKAIERILANLLKKMSV